MAAEPRILTADERVARELAERARGPGKVLSVVMDLDPTTFATAPARRSELTSLLDQARKEIDGDGLDPADRDALARDIERVDAFTTDGGLPTGGASGVAIFVSEPRNMFDVVRLTLPVQPGVVVADDPAVETLAPYLSIDTWGVLLVNSRLARIFLGRADMLRETELLEDDVHRRHDQGGWSQARFQRAVEGEIDAHVRRSLERFSELVTGQRVDHVAIAAPEAIRGHIDRLMPDQMTAHLAGFVDVDIEHTTDDEVVAKLQPLVEAAERRREEELLDRLREQLGTGGRAVAGFPDVSKALTDKRVETVLASERADLPRIVVEDALLQDARVVVLHHHDDLDTHGGLAALLRF